MPALLLLSVWFFFIMDVFAYLRHHVCAEMVIKPIVRCGIHVFVYFFEEIFYV
ncbi:hypothetical protein Fmac_016119 [Flemingia macrophylla]|uniref:Uncharacterized protein n=1 Tax=Flemingia macrophylla TaxID=520843 RepID=A0ABD1MGM9_9FABA